MRSGERLEQGTLGDTLATFASAGLINLDGILRPILGEDIGKGCLT